MPNAYTSLAKLVPASIVEKCEKKLNGFLHSNPPHFHEHLNAQISALMLDTAILAAVTVVPSSNNSFSPTILFYQWFQNMTYFATQFVNRDTTMASSLTEYVKQHSLLFEELFQCFWQGLFPVVPHCERLEERTKLLKPMTEIEGSPWNNSAHFNKMIRYVLCCMPQNSIPTETLLKENL